MAAQPRSMKVVHEQFEKLEHVVDNLNEKTRGLLLRERREFLAAYRAHTFKIQNELRDLRKRVAEEQSRESCAKICGSRRRRGSGPGSSMGKDAVSTAWIVDGRDSTAWIVDGDRRRVSAA